MRIVIVMRLGLALLGLPLVVGQKCHVVQARGVIDNYHSKRLINAHNKEVDFLDAWIRSCIEEESECAEISPVIVKSESLMGVFRPALRSKKKGRLVTAKKYQNLGWLMQPIMPQAPAELQLLLEMGVVRL